MVGAAVMPAHASAWAIAGATAAGARHLLEGASSQDAFVHGRYHAPPGREVLFLAVADGAGSAARSAEGAAVAVGTARHAVRGRLTVDLPTTGPAWRSLMTDIACETGERVGRATAALSDDGSGAEFGCTLVVAVVVAPWMSMFAIGDSFAVLRRVDRGLHLPYIPVHPDGDVTQTALLSGDDAMFSLAIAVVEDPGLEAVVLASDGLDRAALAHDGQHSSPHAPFLNPLIDAVATDQSAGDLAAYLLGDGELSDMTDDDRTLLIAVRR